MSASSNFLLHGCRLAFRVQVRQDVDLGMVGIAVILVHDVDLDLAEAAGKGGAWRQIEGLKSQMDRVRFLALKHFPVDRLIGQVLG